MSESEADLKSEADINLAHTGASWPIMQSVFVASVIRPERSISDTLSLLYIETVHCIHVPSFLDTLSSEFDRAKHSPNPVRPSRAFGMPTLIPLDETLGALFIGVMASTA